MEVKQLQLKDFAVSPVSGFLPENPIPNPTDNPSWHETVRSLPKLLHTNQLENILRCLPRFKVELDKSRAELEVDMRNLAYLAHAYLWRAQEVPQNLPHYLAEPWVKIAQSVKRPPVLSYGSYCLYNWSRLKPDQPPHLGNIMITENFLGGGDEDWFILVHVDIECRAAKALAAIPELLVAATNHRVPEMIRGLKQVAAGIADMNATMARMPERCDPYIYYTRVRPYIFGSKNNPSLPNGLVYENCFNGKPQFYRGETGAQSSIVPTLDALLGVAHQDDPLRTYLIEMRDYMIPEHRSFIEAVELHGGIRTQVVANKTNQELAEAYNQCVDQLFAFRETHLQYAANYIHKQGMQANNSTAFGTGGTPFMTYLSKHRDETRVSLL